MHKSGLATLVINADTNHEAHKTGRNLWAEAREKVIFILISPEQMRTPGFFRLLNDPVFEARICVLGVDECHLIYWWGQKLRPDFRQICLIRSRLPIRGDMRIPVVGVTATLRVGDTMDCILSALAFKPGSFHLIRRSNLRPDIQIILREMQSGMGSDDFPELDWIITDAENTVVFCKTIALGFRVTAYLWHKAKNLPNRDRQIRMFNSLNWPDYNTDTLDFLEDNPAFSITVATDTLSVGWDGKHIRNAVLLGEPNDTDEFVQKIGRIRFGHNQDPSVDCPPRAILYYSHGAKVKALRLIETEDQRTGGRPIRKKETEEGMDISMARVLTAACYPRCLDILYDNPAPETTGTIAKCQCSGIDCEPEDIPKRPRTRVKVGVSADALKAKRGQTMTKYLREHGEKRLRDLRWLLFDAAEDRTYGIYPPEAFMSDMLIKTLLDHFYFLENVFELVPLLEHNPFLEHSHGQIWEFFAILRVEFSNIRDARKAKISQISTDMLPNENTDNSDHEVDPKPGKSSRVDDMEMDVDEDCEVRLQLQ
jgi:hypothetical protein